MPELPLASKWLVSLMGAVLAVAIGRDTVRDIRPTHGFLWPSDGACVVVVVAVAALVFGVKVVPAEPSVLLA